MNDKNEVMQYITDYLKMAHYNTEDNKCFIRNDISVYINGEAIKNANNNFIGLEFMYKGNYIAGEFLDCSEKNITDTATMLISFYTRIIMRLQRREAIR